MHLLDPRRSVHRRSCRPLIALCFPLILGPAAAQVPHASRPVRTALKIQTASTVLDWGSTQLLVGSDAIRGVYIGTISKESAGVNPTCPSGNWYEPAMVRNWIPTADSVIKAADPDAADPRKSTQTLFLPDREGNGVMFGRLRKSAQQWDPSATLYFADSLGRGQLTLQADKRVAQDFLVALARAAAVSAVADDGQDPRARICDQYGQLPAAAAAGFQGAQLKDLPAPSVPDSFSRAGLEGLVLVRYVVLPTGRADIITADFLFASHPLLIPAVRQALGKARFEPARRDGTAIPMCVRQAFRFTTSH